MMTNNGGFQSNYPPNQGGSNPYNDGYNSGNGGYNSHPSGFQRSQTYMPPNPNYPPPQQQYPPVSPLQHTNTYMPPQPQMYPPQPNAYPPQQPQPPDYGRANTYMPPPSQPYQNPPPSQPYQNPPMYPPQQPPYNPPPQMGRANTYAPALARPPTIYDHLGVSGPRPPIPLSSPNTMPYPPQPYAPSPYGQMGSNFNPEKDCEVLHAAVHGAGTDEKAIINIIVNRNAAQWQEIRNCYKSCYGKDLIKRLREDTSGNFREVVAGMFMTPAEFDALCLYIAMKGAGTDDGVLIEIIGTRTNQQIMQIKEAFQKFFNDSLEKWVKGDTSGNYKNLLIALLQGNRSMNQNPDPNMCQNDAQALYKAGEGRWGTDEATFIRIFANRSPAEMAMINDCYTRLRGKGLLKAIDNEFSGNIKKLLETVVGGLLDPAGYFAKRIREAVKGLGTNDTKLVRVIVSRSEIDLKYIKQAYQTMYGRDMLHDVRDDTSGFYKEILTRLISRC